MNQLINQVLIDNFTKQLNSSLGFEQKISLFKSLPLPMTLGGGQFSEEQVLVILSTMRPKTLTSNDSVLKDSGGQWSDGETNYSDEDIAYLAAGFFDEFEANY